MMSEKVYYRVGRHFYCVEFCDKRNTVALLPSSEPFRQADAPQADIPMLFHLKVDDGWHPSEKGKEIGVFDCGGNNHSVYVLADGSYHIVVKEMSSQWCCLLQATDDFSQATLRLFGTDSMRTFGLNNALMMMYAFAGADKMTVLMHASVVSKDGKGYLCLGVSGTGKSTHIRNWLKYIPGTECMNDDNPVVRICDDGVVRVFGSPWSGKTPCYRDVEAPVGGFLQLKKASHNRIMRVGIVDGFAFLMPSCSVMKWDQRNYLGTCDTVAGLMERVPVYWLENLPDETACRLSCETLMGTVLTHEEKTAPVIIERND